MRYVQENGPRSARSGKPNNEPSPREDQKWVEYKQYTLSITLEVYGIGIYHICCFDDFQGFRDDVSWLMMMIFV